MTKLTVILAGIVTVSGLAITDIKENYDIVSNTNMVIYNNKEYSNYIDDISYINRLINSFNEFYNDINGCFKDKNDEDIENLSLFKGTMNLIDEDKRKEIVEYLRKKEIIYSCGGSCPNTMVTLKSLGIETTLAGGIGFDELGEMYKSRLKELGVRDELVKNNAATGTSIILVTQDRERTMCTFLGANRNFDQSDVNLESAKNADIFYFTGYMWDTESQQRAIRKVLDKKKEYGFKVAFDIADPFAVGRYRQTFFDIIKEYVDIVFANSEEARYLIDNYDAYECAKSIGKLCPVAIVKNGKKGSYISENGNIYEIPVYGTSKPVDTTGAGDTYASGFLYGVQKGYGVEDSGKIASILAGEIINQIGAQFSVEKSRELKRYLEKNFPTESY